MVNIDLDLETEAEVANNNYLTNIAMVIEYSDW